jgi:hypothetical protein
MWHGLPSLLQVVTKEGMMNDWYRLIFSANEISAAKHLEMEGHFEKFFLAAGSPEDAALFRRVEDGRTIYFSPGAARIAMKLIHSAGKRYSLDVEAERTYDAAHLFLTRAKEHVIREPLPIPSLETVFEVTVNGRVHKVPGTKLQRWIMKRREEWKGPRGLLFKQRPVLGP